MNDIIATAGTAFIVLAVISIVVNAVIFLFVKEETTVNERQIKADVQDVLHSPGFKEVQRQILGNEVTDRSGWKVVKLAKELIGAELDATVERAREQNPNPRV